jgi:hypothetical protein
MKKEKQLTQIQRETLKGSLLGDGGAIASSKKGEYKCKIPRKNGIIT